MIDTHCHLLPGLDDGPRGTGDAVDLSRQLAAIGVELVLCTPHVSRRYPTDAGLAAQRLAELRVALRTAGVALELELSAEVSPARLVAEPLEVLEARSIRGRFLLVELEPDTPAAFVETALERLAEAGLRPVFAHPERSRAVRDQPSVLDRARAARALVQVVAPSLTGRWGADTERAAWRLLAGGHVDLLASDAHRARPEGPHLARAAGLVVERLGEGALRELTEHAPARLLARTGPRAA